MKLRIWFAVTIMIEILYPTLGLDDIEDPVLFVKL